MTNKFFYCALMLAKELNDPRIAGISESTFQTYELGANLETAKVNFDGSSGQNWMNRMLNPGARISRMVGYHQSWAGDELSGKGYFDGKDNKTTINKTNVETDNQTFKAMMEELAKKFTGSESNGFLQKVREVCALKDCDQDDEVVSYLFLDSVKEIMGQVKSLEWDKKIVGAKMTGENGDKLILDLKDYFKMSKGRTWKDITAESDLVYDGN
ncbi:hypothetical protein N9N67_11700 [Bacteriovoracaceae bacterium]|nr:hypothetical protein [Bacteriovoracaceae bacterium]